MLACYLQNNHGSGLAYNAGGLLIVNKTFESFEDFWSVYSAIPLESTILSHHRVCSAGEISIENRHPFIINPNLVMAMNGTLTNFKGDKDEKRSDTYIFNESILVPFSQECPDFCYSEWGQRLLLETVRGDKMVFLDNQGKYIILNDSKGEWIDEGNWVSNLLWRSKLPKIQNNNSHLNNNSNSNNNNNNQSCQVHHHSRKDKRTYKLFNQIGKGNCNSAPEIVNQTYQNQGKTREWYANLYGALRTEHRFVPILKFEDGKFTYGDILTKDELLDLCILHRRGFGNLKKKNIIAKVCKNDIQKLETERYEHWLQDNLILSGNRKQNDPPDKPLNVPILQLCDVVSGE